MDTVPGIDAARRATIEVYDRGAKAGQEHRGQGLLLALDDQRIIVLTCHHVIAPVAKENLCIRVREANDQLSGPIPAQYDEQRSQPGRDAVFLLVDRAHVSARPRPLLHALKPKAYAGSLTATGLTYMEPESFDARIGATTRLEVSAETSSGWPDPPKLYNLPVTYRLANPTDARPGISGGVVLCENGVVIIGKPRSGKTRLAWRLLQERPKTVVVIPRASEPPIVFNGWGLIDQDVVLFFDDLHETALSSRPLAWRERLQEVTGHSCLLICTTRDGEEWKRVQGNQSRLLRILGRSSRIYTSPVVEKGETEGEDLSRDQGWQLAQVLGLSNQEFDRRFDGTPGSITLDLDEMRSRYERLRDEARGTVPMSRLLDSAKLLYVARQPRFRSALLRDVAEQIRGEGRIGPDTWETVKRRTQEEGFGQFDNNDEFHTYRPYLEECVEDYAPSEEEVGAVLPLLSKAKDYEGLLYLGFALQEYNPLLAELAYRTSSDGGNTHAKQFLRMLLTKQSERQEEVEKAYADEVLAMVQLASFSTKAERFDTARAEEAEPVLQEAIRAGIKEASFMLGRLLANQPERKTEAEQLLRDAVANGNTEAAFLLGLLLAKQPGREAEAEQILQNAIHEMWILQSMLIQQQLEFQTIERLSQSVGISALGWGGDGFGLLGDGGQFASEKATRIGLAAANKELSLYLKRSPAQLWSEQEEAERDILVGMVQSYSLSLGRLLAEQPGWEAEAEQILREVIAAGYTAAAGGILGFLLAKQPGREAEAEQVWQEGLAAGYTEIAPLLGLLLARQPGQEEAEKFFRQVFTAGITEAAFPLGLMLAAQPGREAEAERVLRQALAAGHAGDMEGVLLGILLSLQAGREEEAEQAFQQGLVEGSEGYIEAALFLGLLLAAQPGREAEAEQVLRQALKAGYMEALFFIGFLWSGQPGREAEAEQVYLLAREYSHEGVFPVMVHLLTQQSGWKAELEQRFHKASEFDYFEGLSYIGLIFMLTLVSKREAKEKEMFWNVVIEVFRPAIEKAGTTFNYNSIFEAAYNRILQFAK